MQSLLLSLSLSHDVFVKNAGEDTRHAFIFLWHSSHFPVINSVGSCRWIVVFGGDEEAVLRDRMKWIWDAQVVVGGKRRKECSEIDSCCC